MNIVILTHPEFFGSQSMPRYAKMLAEGLRENDHSVEVWTAQEYFHKIPLRKNLRKWLGYLDQFLIFPREFKNRLKDVPTDTLFVFADHALGPWVPIVAKKYPHVVHCHDFLAQRSALSEIPENKVAFTGKIYQKWIRSGYRNGKNFISISRRTRDDLQRFLHSSPQLSEVVYNGLNQDFKPGDVASARKEINVQLGANVSGGYILHVGGNQYYKNRRGVLDIYSAWRRHYNKKIPLLMIGPKPTDQLVALANNSGFAIDIHFATNVSDKLLKLAYQGASVLLFPSLDEGFGWPIAEAMASGCPVITTEKAPMTEVGGESCFYIPPYPSEKNVIKEGWKLKSASVLNRVLELSPEERQKICEAGIRNALRFCPKTSIGHLERIYSIILQEFKKQAYYEDTSSYTINGPRQWRSVSGDPEQYS